MHVKRGLNADWAISPTSTSRMDRSSTLQSSYPRDNAPKYLYASAARQIFPFEPRIIPQPRQNVKQTTLDILISNHSPDGQALRNKDNAQYKIKKPSGQVTRISRGGYSLAEVLHWDKEQYWAVSVSLILDLNYHPFSSHPGVYT